ncbi:MAG: ChbG/HpnK family deacetylase [Alphaproteobacteria bacterium]
MSGPLVLCADDFGFAPGINRAIHALARDGRLSAVSCMVTAPSWHAGRALLPEITPVCDVGLHLTLTDLASAAPMPRLAPDGRLPTMGVLTKQAFLRRLDRQEIAAEIERQVAALEAVLGRAPDHIDSHKHIHLLPVVRVALLDLFQTGRLDRARTYIRSCWEAPARVAARGIAVASTLATTILASPLAAAARRAGIAANDSFRGMNDFRRERPFGDLFRRFAAGPGARPLIMCHPGFPDAELAALDPVVERRQDEFDYLAGPELARDLAAAGRCLARFPWT